MPQPNTKRSGIFRPTKSAVMGFSFLSVFSTSTAQWKLCAPSSSRRSRIAAMVCPPSRMSSSTSTARPRTPPGGATRHSMPPPLVAAPYRVAWMYSRSSGMRSCGSSWPANTTAPPITTSTSGYLSPSCAWISPASRAIAACTSPASDTRSELSRKAQESLGWGMASAPALREDLREGLADLRVAQAEFHRRLQIAELAATVVALAADVHGQHALPREQRADCVRQLDFAAAPRLGRREQLENRRCQHIAPDHGQRRGRILGRGLLHDGADRRDLGFRFGRTDDAVAAGLLARHLLHAQQRAAFLFEAPGHTDERGRLRVDQIVGQQHREGLVADHRLRAQHGMAQAERLRLPQVDAAAAGGQHAARDREELLLAAERAFELGVEVEMVLDRALVSAGHENHVGDAGGRGFLDRVLDQRLVHDRQHFLGARLGGRQEAAAQ